MMAKKKLILIDSQHNSAHSYEVKKTGDIILCNTRPPPEGGIGNSLQLTLPVAADNVGRVITVKDVGSYTNINAIVIHRSPPDLIAGGNTSLTMTQPGAYKTFVSDGFRFWHEIG